MAWFFVPAHEATEPVDVLGGILSVTRRLCGVTISAVRTRGPGADWPIAVVAGIAFFSEAKNRSTTCRLRPRIFVAACAGPTFGSLMAAMFVGQQFLQRPGYSTLDAGLAILPAVGMVPVAPAQLNWSDRGARFTFSPATSSACSASSPCCCCFR
jgi:hypothetical protein